ncbi:hypothetical protein IAU60_000625 [Kwoniella sp. DSM 27419]
MSAMLSSAAMGFAQGLADSQCQPAFDQSIVNIHKTVDDTVVMAKDQGGVLVLIPKGVRYIQPSQTQWIPGPTYQIWASAPADTPTPPPNYKWGSYPPTGPSKSPNATARSYLHM